MAAAFRQSKSVGTAGAATTVVSPALTSAVLAGSRLVAYIVWGASTGSIGTVSDSVNGTTGWVKVTNSNASEGTGPTQGEFWTNPNSAAGSSLVVTATFAAGASFGFTAIAVHEVTGTDPTEGAAATASARSQSSVTNFTTANITPTVAGCYIIGGCSNDVDSVAPTAGGSFTLRETTANQVTGTEDQVQGAAAAIAASFNFAAAKTGIVNVVAFKPAPSGGQAPLMLPLMQMAPNGPLGPMALAMRLFRIPSPDVVSALSLTAGVGALTLTGFAPTLNMTLTGGVGAATLTGFAPSITGQVTAGVGQVTLSGFAPNATATLGGAVGQATLTGFAPTLSGAVTAGVGQLSASGFAPSLSAQMTAGAGAAILSGFAPSIVFGAQLSVTAGTGLVVLTGYAPTITLTITTVAGPVEAKWVLLGRQGRRGIGKSR